MRVRWTISCGVLVALAGVGRAEAPPATAPAIAAPSLYPNMDGGVAAEAAAGKPCFDGFDVHCDPAQDHIWASAEYLLWWVHGQQLPPLIGSLPVSQAQIGTLPPGSITTLFGGDNFSFNDHSGARLTVGGFLDCDKLIGFEASYFLLGQKSKGYSAGSQSPIVGNLFTDITTGLPSIIFPINPLQATEFASATVREHLWGAEANYRGRAITFADSPLDILVGFRYLNLDGQIDTFSQINFLGSGTLSDQDHFLTKNHFYGAQVGASFDMREGPWSLDLISKVALGVTREKVGITGWTQTNFVGQGLQTFPGGILAQPSNFGTYHSDRFGVLPEFTANLGYSVTQHIRVYLGYTFIYLNKVIRPGDAIDPQVNPSFIQGLIVQNPTQQVRPLPLFNQSSFWAQGINFGMEVRF